MIRKPNILISVPLFAAAVMTISACKRISRYSAREVEIKNFLDLSRFGDILKEGWALSGSSVSLDSKGNIYFLDIKRHRVLIINKSGEEIGQIGRIGQDKESLFNPWGICIDYDKIYILNNAGREIKAFTLDNRFLSCIELNDSYLTESLSAKGGRYFIGEKTTNPKEYNQKKLITVRDKNGDLIKSMGRIIPCESYIGYLGFNRVYFQFINNKIIGTHRYAPVLFAYEVDGRELYYKKLNSLIPEMKELAERAKEMNYDTPDSHKKKDDYSSRYLLYCCGLGVNQKQDVYYAMRVFDAKSDANNKFFVIRLDKLGNAIEKIIYKKEGRSLQVGPIVADPENKLYAIGFTSEIALFFPLRK